MDSVKGDYPPNLDGEYPEPNLVTLPEEYWPKGGTDVSWDPDFIRYVANSYNNTGLAGTMTINSGILLFLLDQYEIVKKMRSYLTTSGMFIKGVPDE